MKIKQYVSFAAAAVLLAAAAPAMSSGGDQGIAKGKFISKNDYQSPSVVGKSGTACAATCDKQPTLDACKAALLADNCEKSRDAWREANPTLRTYEKSRGRF